jgi:hypothetical protein
VWEFVPFILVAIVGAGYFAWTFLRGEAVGTVKGLLQGEAVVPGATTSITVKRHPMAGGALASAELQFRFLALAETRELDARASKGLAEVLREADPWVRGEG